MFKDEINKDTLIYLKKRWDFQPLLGWQMIIGDLRHIVNIGPIFLPGCNN